jgi:nucleoside-diphosphate-sugar epimerase
MKILITGGGGFVGAWVAEYLHLSGRANPRVGVRDPSSAARTARFGITDVALCDVLDRPSLVRALAGVDAVFHCALIPPAQEPEGARTLCEAMKEAGVRRLVYLSSIAVFGETSGQVDESVRPPDRLDAYAGGKRQAEQVLTGQSGLDITLLRPSLVYGPYDTKLWTEKVARRVLSGQWGRLGRYGEGTCNLVYVQDLAEAMAACLETPASIGETLIVNGPDTVTWNAYWNRLSELLTGEPLPEIDPRPILRRSRYLYPLREMGKLALGWNPKLVMRLYGANQMSRVVFRSVESNLRLFPTAAEFRSYGREVRYRPDRLHRVTGYAPRTSFEEGTELSARWLGSIGIGRFDDLLGPAPSPLRQSA